MHRSYGPQAPEQAISISLPLDPMPDATGAHSRVVGDFEVTNLNRLLLSAGPALHTNAESKSLIGAIARIAANTPAFFTTVDRAETLEP
jgi:hypothetical protein